MTVVRRSNLVQFSQSQMFALVADVSAYQYFLPWCRRSVVHESNECSMRASLEVAKGPFSKRFTTLNKLTPNRCIDIELVEGPFRSLDGRWMFHERGGHACFISLNLNFEFVSRIVAATFGPVFNEIAGTMVNAFSRRAWQLYGKY
ncbi:MAG: ubiquinone-binding protein [Gammaproteobacteria bacterium]|nr:ubiquinone-binding protein [Gammaproteobacteria bacterium]